MQLEISDSVGFLVQTIFLDLLLDGGSCENIKTQSILTRKKESKVNERLITSSLNDGYFLIGIISDRMYQREVFYCE